MGKSVLCFPLLILAIYATPASSQQATGTYPFQGENSNRHFPYTPRQVDRGLRWRPLESEEGSGTAEPEVNLPAYSGRRDYTDEPFGLPRGTYRRIEERHTITPHLEGYRFRPIDPDEQVRNRGRNEQQERADRNRSYAPPRGYDGSDGFRPSGQPPTIKFRPDGRLDKRSNGAPARYAFPMGADAPMFRPR